MHWRYLIMAQAESFENTAWKLLYDQLGELFLII